MVGVGVLVGRGVEVGRGIRVCVEVGVRVLVEVGEAGMGVGDAVIVGDAPAATDVAVGDAGMGVVQPATTISVNSIRHSRMR